tara:strand:+ start:231 stop:1076 length:846 start_codon:yes stop_codon:yes gene_type:complete
MIIWLASYPKSGNTYLRSFLASYYYSEDGNFNFDQLLKIHQFPNFKFSRFASKTKEEASKNWMFNQNAFFKRDSFNLVKTHNCLYPYKENSFTSKNETIGAIYIVRDPRNLITSLKHHYSIDYKKAMEHMLDENSSLLEKSHDNDYSNFTYLNSWSNHYNSWKNSSEFKTLFIKYEDLEKDRTEIFKKVIFFINEITENNQKIDEKKLFNSIKTTSFSNLRNKELNEGFEESVYSNKTGKKINFFNLGFNNRWQKILPIDIKNQTNEVFKKSLDELNYPNT